MEVRDANEADLSGILEIYNDAVVTTTAIWNEKTVDLENRRAWLTERRRTGFPVLVAVENERVIGYASFGDFRAWDGYRHTVEHSIYVRQDARRQGVGRALLELLIARARAMGKHAMIAGIEGMNDPSIRLHECFGFRKAGHLQAVGTKFGRWLDLVFMQIVFD